MLASSRGHTHLPSRARPLSPGSGSARPKYQPTRRARLRHRCASGSDPCLSSSAPFCRGVGPGRSLERRRLAQLRGQGHCPSGWVWAARFLAPPATPGKARTACEGNPGPGARRQCCAAPRREWGRGLYPPVCSHTGNHHASPGLLPAAAKHHSGAVDPQVISGDLKTNDPADNDDAPKENRGTTCGQVRLRRKGLTELMQGPVSPYPRLRAVSQVAQTSRTQSKENQSANSSSSEKSS